LPTYLVTGGAGFIGSHVVQTLLARGQTVRIADDFSSGLRENVPSSVTVDLVEGDLADPAVAARAVAGCKYVIHLAAIPSVPRSVKDPVESHRANVDGTLNVLVAARDAHVKRLVFAGSSAAYGDSGFGGMSSCFGSVGESPYTDEEPAYTSRLTPASRAATRMFNEASTFARFDSSGSSTERGTDGIAAWCST